MHLIMQVAATYSLWAHQFVNAFHHGFHALGLG